VSPPVSREFVREIDETAVSYPDEARGVGCVVGLGIHSHFESIDREGDSGLVL
jgi:hypothetical protein